MKKKLLTLLLSIAVILTSTVTVFAVELDDEPTVAEILDTVDGGFPMLEYSTIPENAWVNSDGKQLFLNATKDQLLTDDGGSFDTRYPTKKSNNDYIWSLASITITFIMDSNNELSSIKINGLSYPYDGTYVAPSKTVASILATVEGGFPTYSDDVPSNAWKNENLKSIYLNASKTELFLDDGKSSFETDIVASKDKNKNVYSYSPYFGVTATFFMDDNSRLSSINFYGLPDDPYADYNGTYVAPHVHTFTYTASDNIITATCTEGCDEGYDTVPLTLTLTAPTNLVYDGNAKAFTFADGEADAWVTAGLELPTITYLIKQNGQSEYMPLFGTLKYVGNYMAKISVDGKDAQVLFTIDKATPYIKTNPVPSDINLGQKLLNSTLAGGYVQVSETDSTQIGGLFEWKEPETTPALEDSNKTLYDVIFTPADTENYNTASCQVMITVENTAPTNTYTASFYAQNNGNVSLETLTDIVEGTAYSVDGNKITIGDTVITATANQGYKFVSWYDGIADVTEGGTITKNMTFIAMIEKEWSEWQDFGPMVYKYNVLVTGSELYLVQTRSDEFGNKQFKVLGWGAGAYSQAGIDLIIDVDSNNVCSIENQEIQTGIWICDLHSRIPEYEQCVYKPVTKEFTLLVAYHDGVKTYGNYETLVFCNEVTNDAPESESAKNHGYLSVDSLGMPGEVLTVTINPAEGYQLKSGSLKVTYNDGKQNQVIIPEATQTEGEYAFTMPAYAVVVMAEFEEKAITIADILPEDFPTTRDYGWINEKGKRLYAGNNLIINGNESVGISTILTLTADNTYTYNGSSIWTFNMNNGVLKSVVVSDYGDDKDGTYVPATFISEVSFEYEDFDFSNLSFAPAKAPDGAKYEVIGCELILLKEGETKYYYWEGKWYDEDTGNGATPKLSEIDQAAAAVGIKTSGANTFDSLAVEVTADNKDGSSKVLTRLQDVSGAKNGEGFERYNDQTLICCLLFDVPVIEEVSFTYGDFNFDDFTFDAPTVPSDALYIPFIESELFLLLGSKGVASSPNYGGVWFEYGTTNPIDNIKEVEFDTIAFNTWFESEYKFDSNITVKGNGVALDPVDNITQLQDGKTEGFFVFEIGNNVIASVKTANKYKIIEGNKPEINKAAIKDTLFTSDADFSKFIEVRVDGKIIIKDEDYTVESGSTKATLKSSYLSTLALGEHTLAIISTDGQASTTFTITRNSKPSPNPGYIVPNTGVEGKHSNNRSLLKLSSLSILAVGTYLVIKKKKDNE